MRVSQRARKASTPRDPTHLVPRSRCQVFTLPPMDTSRRGLMLRDRMTCSRRGFGVWGEWLCWLERRRRGKRVGGWQEETEGEEGGNEGARKGRETR